MSRRRRTREFAPTNSGSVARPERVNLREAIEMVRDAHYTKEVDGELCEGFEVEADDGTGRPLICIVEDALAAPPRNCERFQTTEQAKEAYFAEVRHVSVWDGCETERLVDWLLTPATEKEGVAK